MVLFFYPMDGAITSYRSRKHFSVVLQRRARASSEKHLYIQLCYVYYNIYIYKYIEY